MTLTTEGSAERTLLGGLARGSTANLLGAAVLAGATLGSTIVVTRGLDQATAGVFFSATSLFLVAIAVGQLGTDVGLVYFLSRVRSLGQPGQRRWLYRTATRPVLAVAVVMGVVLFVFAPQISGVVNPDNVTRSVGYLRGVAAFLPLAALENVTLAGTRGMGTMRAHVMTEQLGRPLLQLLLVMVAVSFTGGGSLGAAWAFAYLPAALLAVWYWNRIGTKAEQHLGDSDPTRAKSAIPAKAFWRFTGPRAAASIAQVAMQRLDIVLVAALAGAAPAAIYTASTRFLVLGLMGQRAIALAVQPLLGEALAVSDMTRAKRLYRVSTSWLMLVSWPLYLTFIFFGGPILDLFGRDYAGGRSVLILLSLTMLLGSGCGMVDVVLVMAGRSSWSLANLALSLGLQVGLDIWLIPQLGFFGAAIGWSIAILVANAVPLVQIAVVLGLHPFGRSVATSFVVLIGCFALVPAVTRLFLGDDWSALLLSLAIGGVAYIVIVWRLRDELSLTFLAEIRRRGGVRRKDEVTEVGANTSHAAVAALWPAPAMRRVTWSPRGTGAPYLALPGTKAPRLLVPIGVPGSERSLIRHAGTRRIRVARRLLRTVLRWRWDNWLPFPRLWVTADPDGVEEHLRRVLGQRVAFTVLLGPPRANLKPVLQVFGPDGTTIAFAKVATSRLTERLLETETAALRMLADTSMPGVKVPTVIDSGRWRDVSILVQTVLRHSEPQRPPMSLPGPALAVIARSAGVEVSTLDESTLWRDLSVVNAARWHGIDVTPFKRLRRTIPSWMPLAFGAWHGDFGPWNAGWNGAELEVWDWERYATGVPIGMDGAHWRMQLETMTRRFDAKATWGRMQKDVAEVQRLAGCDESHADVVAACYLLTVWTRYHNDAKESSSAALRARVTLLSRIADVATHQVKGTRGRVRS